MRLRLLWVYCALFIVGSSFSALATHQVGGQLEMRAVGNVPGHFKIIVTNYMEDGRRAATQVGGQLNIFSKRDNALMLTFYANEVQREPIIFTNELCAEQRNLNFIAATYEADIQLSPDRYTDSQGYYISFQTRNRNGGINNINSPLQTGFTFYLEFPPLQLNGQPVNNSSPRFGPINGEYICLGEPFTFAFGATDPDGDQLRYSLVTPLDQINDRVPTPGPYPDVNWLSGFGPNNAIPGSPTLSVNAQTGQLSVTASQLGLFVFAMKVEEFRNGVKIGEVRRDFQFLVVDCPKAGTPTPTVQILNQPPTTREATVCQGDALALQATVDSTWNYQWRRNGVNLSDATGTSLTVKESGEYTVFVSPKQVCGKSAGSEMIKVNVLDVGAPLTATGHLCATTGSINLNVSPGADISYQWYQNEQPLAGRTATNLTISDPGRYWVTMTHTKLGCTARTEVYSAARSPAVQASIRSSNGRFRLCPQESLQLEGNGGIRYVWMKDGQSAGTSTDSHFQASAAGSYVITATDADGCQGTSPPFVLEQIPPVQVTLDAIPSVCGTAAPAMTLTGSPAGGEFGGAGVAGNEFSPQRAGIGDHVITYTVKAAPECAGTVSSQTAVVSVIPTIELPESISVWKGSTLTLTPAVTGNPVTYRWSPDSFVADANQSAASVVGITEDMTYTLEAVNATGCRAEQSVRIFVVNYLGVPDAFSPNDDGINDSWELKGIEAFPAAEVTVFNRWGEVIFKSDKGYPVRFDGTLKGTRLPTGIYPYILRLDPDRPVMRGSLSILR